MTAPTEQRPAPKDEGRIHKLGPIELIDEDADLVTVRVWQLPLRYVHWSFVFCLIALSVTGYYIGHPFRIVGFEAGYLMGKVRFVHFVAAWVFMLTMVVRIALFFIGNRWARWDQFVPVNPDRRRWIPKTLAYYVFIRSEPPPAIGHNPLAGLTYLLVYFMFCVAIITGLALQSFGTQSGWQWFVSGWVVDWLGIQHVRLVHHMIMWLAIGFTIHHLFSVILIDHEERSGITSSMVSGMKRLPRERL